MEKRNVRFEDVQQALLWLLSHPLEKLYYDEYGNYVIYGPFSKVIEDWHYIGGEDEGYDSWDFDKLTLEEFVDNFNGIILQNNY